MEEAISDVVHGGDTKDLMLVTLLDLTIASIRDERPVFPSIMDEPVLYRYFRRFTKKALDGQKKIDDFLENPHGLVDKDII